MSRRSLAVVFAVGTLVSVVGADPARAQVTILRPQQWTGGLGVGFMANTPDGAAEFGLKGHADYFLTDRISVGPLAQYAGAGNDFLFGVSAQAKYWWSIRGTRNPTRLVVQGGIGFVRAGIRDDDSGVADTFSSFLIPVGVGLDYALTPRMAVTADFFLNFTSLGDTFQVSGDEVDLHTNVMPAFYLGVRF